MRQRKQCRNLWVEFQSATDKIGGRYYVSVTSGYYCVNTRKFLIPHGQAGIKAIRGSLAIRLREWINLKKIMADIDSAHPTLVTVVPCFQRDDHMNQLGALQCSECPSGGVVTT